ncbi:hypothetical protein R6Q59_010258 [Mikania micrantha]
MRYFKAGVRRYRIRKTKAMDEREKSLKVSSSSSESSDDSVEDTTGLVESRLADILYNSESSERFNSEKPLSVSFKNIVSSARIQPGYFKIQTKVGLSWFVKLVKEDDNYLFIEGWKVLVDQLNLSLGSYNLFEYEGIPTFTITIYSQQQALHVGNSFYTIMLNRQNDEVLIPTTFLSKNYEGKVPPSFIKLQAGKDLKWKVNID